LSAFSAVTADTVTSPAITPSAAAATPRARLATNDALTASTLNVLTGMRTPLTVADTATATELDSEKARSERTTGSTAAVPAVAVPNVVELVKTEAGALDSAARRDAGAELEAPTGNTTANSTTTAVGGEPASAATAVTVTWVAVTAPARDEAT
jgi:hypothetical protein